MTNSTGMVILAGIALVAGGIKITRGDYKLGGIDRPMRCSDLQTPEGQEYQLEMARQNVEQGHKILADLRAQNTKYAPGTVVKIRSCDGSVQTVTVPPGGINASQILEVQQKLAVAQAGYQKLRQAHGLKPVAAQTPPQLVMNTSTARPMSAPIISQPAPATKLGQTPDLAPRTSCPASVNP